MENKIKNIKIELTLEDYFMINEEARKQKLLLDDFIAKILEEKLNEHK